MIWGWDWQRFQMGSKACNRIDFGQECCEAFSSRTSVEVLTITNSQTHPKMYCFELSSRCFEFCMQSARKSWSRRVGRARPARFFTFLKIAIYDLHWAT